MGYIIVIQLICLINPISAQNIIKIVKPDLEKAQTLNELKEIFKSNNFYQNYTFEYENLDLDFLVKYCFITIDKKNREKDKSLKIVILSSQDKIFYKELGEHDKHYNFNKIFESIDSTAFAEATEPYREFYGQIFTPRSGNTRFDFGLCCGNDCGISGHFIFLFLDIFNNKREKIAENLFSIYPSEQLYGYLGLAIMTYKGTIILTDLEKKAMTRVRASNLEVYSCNGCTGGYFIPIQIMFYDGDLIGENFKDEKIIKRLAESYEAELPNLEKILEKRKK